MNKTKDDVLKQATIADAMHWVSMMKRLDDPVVAKLVCDRLIADQDLLKANPGIYMRAQEVLERRDRRDAAVRAAITSGKAILEKVMLLMFSINLVFTWVIHRGYLGYERARDWFLRRRDARALAHPLSAAAMTEVAPRVLIRRRVKRPTADLTIRRAR
jgi:hypothetical protein